MIRARSGHNETLGIHIHRCAKVAVSRALRLSAPPCLLLLLGCIEHRVSVDVPSELASATAVVNSGPPRALGGRHERSGHLPQRLLIHGYLREADGSLLFIDLDCRSPLAWWQRFPIDILTGLAWPGQVTSHNQADLQLRRPITHDHSTLTSLAHAAGYPPEDDNIEE